MTAAALAARFPASAGSAERAAEDRFASFADRLPQTAAAVANFGRGRTPREVVLALAEVKEAALRALQETEKPWAEDVFAAVWAALAEIRSGTLDDLFPLGLAQGGAGTSLHMNICEVLSMKAASWTGQPDAFHFLDDAARRQSTNDVVATAAVVVVQRLIRRVEAAVIALQEALVERERAWRGVRIAARTEWQDAVPMDLSQVAAAWAGTAERDRWRLGKLKERARSVPLGGGAVGVGTGGGVAGLGRGDGYLFAAERLLRELTGLPLQRSQNLTEAVAQRDEFAEVASGFALVASNIRKLCGDLFVYTSSPVAELRLPPLQWGSTAMPLKNNPVLAEYADGLAARAAAAADSIVGYARDGRLQLNAYVPFMLDAFLRAASDLEAALGALVRLLPLLEADQARALENLSRSHAVWNALRDDVPYERLKALAAALPAGPSVSAAVETLRAGIASNLAASTGLDEETIRRRLGFPPAFAETENA